MTRKQVQALTKLLTGSSVKEAALSAGVSERTLFRWLTLPEFTAALKAGERECITNTMRQLSALSGEAVSALADVMRTPEQYGASNKRQAAVSVIELLLKAYDMHEIDERISKLEKLVNEV